MPDSRASLIQAIKARLSEIEEKLDPYNALIEERSELVRVLRRHQPTQPTFKYTVRNDISIGDLAKLGSISIPAPTEFVEDAPKNGARSEKESATSIVTREARHILDGTKSKRMPFSKLLKMLPPTVKDAFTGKYKYQAMKLAIQRSGHKVGIEYKKGGTVRIIPAAAEEARS